MAWYLTPNGVGSGLILLPQGVCALPGQTHTNQTHNTDAQNYSFSRKDHGHKAQTTYLSMPGPHTSVCLFPEESLPGKLNLISGGCLLRMNSYQEESYKENSGIRLAIHQRPRSGL